MKFKHLDINLEKFPFYKRKLDRNKKPIPNRCGINFLVYAIKILKPKKHLPKKDGELDKKLGIKTGPYFAWTQLQFSKLKKFLKTERLKLFINKKHITSYSSFVDTILFRRINYKSAIKQIEKYIDSNQVCGIDISIGVFGLLDHVMLVYGYDDESFYVVDTHDFSKKVGYKRASKQFPLLFQLPKETIKKRWSKFGRVWLVTNNQS